MQTTGAFAQTPPPPFNIEISINPTGELNPRTDEVIVSGTIMCSLTEPEFVDLDVAVTRTVGHKTLQRVGGTSMLCHIGQQPTPWTATVVTVEDQKRTFVPGSASVSVTAFGCY